MDKLISWINEKLVPPLNKFTNTKIVTALMNGFRFAFPLLLAGAFLQILTNLRFAIDSLASLGLDILSVLSFGLMGLVFTIGIAFSYASALEIDPKGATVIAVSVFFLLIKPELVEEKLVFNDSSFGAENFFVSLLAGILVPWLIHFFTKSGLVIKAKGMPSFLRNWFLPLIPGAVAVLLAWTISYPLNINIPQVVSNLSNPLFGILDSYIGMLLWGLIATLTFSVGIHPSATLGATIPVLIAALGENMEAVMVGNEAPHLMTFATLLGFITLGGQGATFTLNLLMLRSKSKTIKRLGKATIWTSLFGINEPLVYGLPIAFNPHLIIPFVLNGGVINTTLTYIAMSTGLVEKTWNIGGIIPAPPGISAFLSTQDVKSLLLVLVMLAINFVVYYPFFKTFEKATIEKEKTDGNK